MKLSRALVEMMISKEFGVPTDSKYFRAIRDTHEMPPELVTPIIS